MYLFLTRLKAEGKERGDLERFAGRGVRLNLCHLGVRNVMQIYVLRTRTSADARLLRSGVWLQCEPYRRIGKGSKERKRALYGDGRSA